MAREYSGRGDPAIVLRLLWRRGLRPSAPGPKPALSVERVVAAAIEVADAEGLDGLSMRRVADQLGVGTMSLYRYVPAKGELLDLMLDAVLGERSGPDPALGWREQLERFARDGLALYRRHPWMLQISLARPPLGPNTLGSWDRMLEALKDTGMSAADTVAATTLVNAYLRGAAEHAVDAAQVERVTGVSEEDYWVARMPFWEDYVEPERFPGITRVWAGGAYDAPADAFEFGLARLLDGLEAYIEAKRSGSNGAGSTRGGSPQ